MWMHGTEGITWVIDWALGMRMRRKHHTLRKSEGSGWRKCNWTWMPMGRRLGRLFAMISQWGLLSRWRRGFLLLFSLLVLNSVSAAHPQRTKRRRDTVDSPIGFANSRIFA